MKKTSKAASTLTVILGLAVMLGGILVYGLGAKEIIELSHPGFIVLIAAVLGIGLITCGVCDLLIRKRTEEDLELEIEMNDERNIALSNAAMASGFKVLSVVLAAVIVILAYAGQLNAAACLIIIGAYFAGQVTFIAKLWYLHKNF